MDDIKSIIIKIVFALLAASVTRMLLPDQKSVRSVRLITGLMVLAVLAAPIKNGLHISLPKASSRQVSFNSVRAQEGVDRAVIEGAQDIISRRVSEILDGFGFSGTKNTVQMDIFDLSDISIKRIGISGTSIEPAMIPDITNALKAEFGQNTEIKFE